jgi:pyruvate carboxylase subunit B
MREVVEKGGYGTSVTPVSQFYWQQAYANVVFGDWNQITSGYGRMVLGYFGKTPIQPDPEIVKLAGKLLKLAPATKSALEIADDDPQKSLKHFQAMLEVNDLEINDENIFIAAACGDKGIKFLKGEAEVNIRTSDYRVKGNNDMAGQYTVVVNGTKYNVDVVEGHDGEVTITNAAPVAATTAPVATTAAPASAGAIEVNSQTPGNVWKILAKVGDSIKEGDPIMILEAMKMEIDIPAPKSGVIKSINVNVDDAVADGQLLATME